MHPFVGQFMGHLKGVSDPEQKRKIIGREFVEVFQAEAQKLQALLAPLEGAQRQAWWLAAFPGAAISLLVLGINLFGDGLRDALDPRLRT